MSFHYHVAPRYTPGSPAQVDREIAELVASDECEAYQHALQGRYGKDQQTRAQKEGLRGVVELRVEQRKSWKVTDLCTGETFERPFKKPT